MEMRTVLGPGVAAAVWWAACGAADGLAELRGRAVEPVVVAVPEGVHEVGTDRPFHPADGEGPRREAWLDAFEVDAYEVPVSLFERFVRETGHVTDAERFGWSFVLDALLPDGAAAEVGAEGAPWWVPVEGATWRAPEGPLGEPARREHPAVHVSHADAEALCAWRGMRLPTEAEWEAAARGGRRGRLYPWGNALMPGGRHAMNIWQGEFPGGDTGEDGYRGTAPVDAFPANGLGLHNAAGNVWEWVADAWKGGGDRVKKGGSFMCHPERCNRYRVAARSGNTPDTSAANLGFRCARSTGRGAGGRDGGEL